jgi:hypothetical protein
MKTTEMLTRNIAKAVKCLIGLSLPRFNFISV